MNKRLAEIAERVAKATPGPWVDKIFAGTLSVHEGPVKASRGTMTSNGSICDMEDLDCSERPRKEIRANARFIASARDDVPWLLRQVELLQQVAEAARRVDSYEDFSDPIVSDEYDPTEHNAARLKLYQVLDALREFNRDGEHNGSN